MLLSLNIPPPFSEPVLFPEPDCQLSFLIADLRIVGESMIEDGIFDGDYVFVRKSATANRGDTVIAMIDGEATCKRYYPETDRIRFEPANQAMEPIYVHRREYRETMLLGQVVAVFRQL